MSSVTTDYNKAFELSKKLSSSGNTDWLAELRQNNYDLFQNEGFPTVKHEEWKYTNVKRISDSSFNLPEELEKTDLSHYQDFINDNEIRLFFIDGILSQKHSTCSELPGGVSIKPLKEAIKDNGDIIQKVINHFPTESENTFTGLNTAFIQEGVFIDVAAKTQADCLINLVYVFTGEQADIMTFPRNILHLGESSQASVVETHISRNLHCVYFNNSMTDISIAANARLNYFKAQADSRNAFHVSNTRIYQERDSHLESFTLTVGGSLVRNNLSIILDGPGCHSGLDGLCTASDHQHIDNHTSVDHREPSCVSDQLYKGLLRDHGRTVFNGKIYVKQKAQLTNAYQLNRNLLLSPNAEADTKPQLEIYADDVKCTHGATVGQMNEEELFYLQSRGIPKNVAINMLSHGFAEDVLLRIPLEGVRDRFRGLLCEYFLNSES